MLLHGFISYFHICYFLNLLQNSMLLQVAEIYNFGQDDLMTEDIDILSCHSDIFVWVGQQVDPKTKVHALKIGEVCFIPSIMEFPFCSLTSFFHQSS